MSNLEQVTENVKQIDIPFDITVRVESGSFQNYSSNNTDNIVNVKEEILFATFSKEMLGKEYFKVPVSKLMQWVRRQNFEIVIKDRYW